MYVYDHIIQNQIDLKISFNSAPKDAENNKFHLG